MKRLLLIIILLYFQNSILAQDSLFKAKVELISPILKSEYYNNCDQIFGYEVYNIFEILINDSLCQVAVFCPLQNGKLKRGLKRGQYEVILKYSQKNELYDYSLNGIDVSHYIQFVIVDICIKPVRRFKMFK